MWIVARLQKFSDFAQSPGSIPFPITIDAGKMVGYLAVYATREDAEADWPDGPFAEIGFIPASSPAPEPERQDVLRDA